jgi:large subunit ribosomal protein L14
MIQVKSYLKTADNSGATIVQCIKIRKQYQKLRKIGTLLLVSVKKLRKSKKKNKIRRGSILLAVLIRTKRKTKRKNNLEFFFSTNSVLLVNKQLKPLSTRVLGLVPRELRSEKLMKIVSMSAGLV